MEKLLERIKKIEALIVGAQTEGEKNAAISAKDRVLNTYQELKTEANNVEFILRAPDSWHKRLLLSICRKYGLKLYRYKGQKYTTVMVNVNEEYLNKIVWKEYLEYSDHLEKLVGAITDGLIDKIHKHEDENLIHGNLE